MKKILIIIAFLILTIGLLFFNGFYCDINSNFSFCEIQYTPIENDSEGIIQSDKTLEVEDLSDVFDFTTNSIHIFKNIENEGISYVDAEEFLYVLHEGLQYYNVSISDEFSLTYKVNYSILPFNRYKYELDLDASENTIYYNDVSFEGAFNVSPNIDYDTNVSVTGGNYQGGVASETIDLDDYDINIVEEDGVYFIPLYLANLLFTGDSLNVYQTNDYLYIISDFNDKENLFTHPVITDSDVEANIVRNTVSYTALFFDYFYGLKQFLGVDSYIEEFKSLGFYQIDTLKEFDEMLSAFIYTLNDLHTSIIDFGYNADEVNPAKPESDSKIWRVYDVYTSDACINRDYEFKFTEYDNYYILELNEFTLKTVDYLKNNLVNIDLTKPIYIDLACNSGGNLIAVFEVLAYMTDERIEFRYENPASGEIFVNYYEANSNINLPNPFYLFTSPMTYSAANLFTSLVKDNELATIIGEPTSGGACSVINTVLPNNLVMTHSSMMAILNKDDEVIEDGIRPDYEINYSYSLTDTLDYIYNYYDDFVIGNITSNYTDNKLSLDLTTFNLPEDMTFINYQIIIKDTSSLTIYSHEEIDSYEFHYVKSLEGSHYQIEIYVNYEYKGINVTNRVYLGLIN